MKTLILTAVALGLFCVTTLLPVPADAAVVVTKRTTVHVHHRRHVHGCRTVTRTVSRHGHHVSVRRRICT